LVFTWFTLVVFMAVSVSLFTSVFYQKPLDLAHWLIGPTATSTNPATSPRAEVTTSQDEHLNELVRIQVALENTKIISDELYDSYLEPGWGILESYVIKVRRDGEARHAVMFQRINRLVQLDAQIV